MYIVRSRATADESRAPEKIRVSAVCSDDQIDGTSIERGFDQPLDAVQHAGRSPIHGADSVDGGGKHASLNSGCRLDRLVPRASRLPQGVPSTQERVRVMREPHPSLT